MRSQKYIAVLSLLGLLFSMRVYGEALDGRKLYHNQKCYACHGMEGRGSIAGPPIQDTGKTREELINLLRKGTKMMRPLRPKQVPDEELAAIVDYVLSLKGFP